MTSADVTDEAIVARIQSGDTEQLRTIMERYEPKLRRYGTRFLSNREDVTDIVQNVFIKAYQNIQSFDTAQRFSPWIYRIAHNAFVNELRDKKHRPFALPDFDEMVGHYATAEHADDEAKRGELTQMVEKGLAGLDDKHREILLLYFMEELSYKEIAEILRVPVGTVGVRLSRAKRALRKLYDTTHLTYE